MSVTLRDQFDLRLPLHLPLFPLHLPHAPLQLRPHDRRPSGRRPLRAAAGILVPSLRCPTPTP